MIQLSNLRVAFDEFVAIPDLNLAIEQGEFFTLLGPSGCGKTTALRSLAGFVQPSGGSIHIGGKDVTHLPSDKRRVGMVFQNYALFPSMTVWENIAFGLRVRKENKSIREKLVREIAVRVDLSPAQLEKNVSELSGGQQQRVAIARALVLKPEILLLDEPLSNLDAQLRHQLRDQLKELQHDFGITTVYVTHDQEEALSMSDRIAVFNKGQVEQVGTPAEIYDTSATEFVCNFIGGSSVLTSDFVAATGTAAGTMGTGTGTSSYLRVEKAAFDPSGAAPGAVAADAAVVSRSYFGLYSRYTVLCHGAEINVLHKENGGSGPQPGQRVTLYIDPEHILHYDAGTGLRVLPGQRQPEAAAR
ncbi:ABC transporter ATP-binding protein [Arthrobacter crystallopoietes]|uniref:ABC transporter ATP-binding protein n=1 Tax=Crystallibacter crystallopoietes TaxID=37928 RepID=UPI0011110A95|nr:ABC transporter ATP-binding protein [Arthrobacter crystallopoietes]